MADHIERHASNQSEICGGIALPGPVGVLAELHVQHPVLTILDGPRAADRLGKAGQVGERTQIVPLVRGRLAVPVAGRFDPPYGL